MPTGTVKWFGKRKGWGFITQEARGERVSFDRGHSDGGAQAENVVRWEEV